MFWRALWLLALLSLSQPVSEAMAAPKGKARSAPTPRPPTRSSELAVLAGEVRKMRVEIEELRASLARADDSGETDTLHRTVELPAMLHQTDAAPPWADAAQQQVLHRLERLQTVQERLAARIETPVPRLDEPLVLLTVGGATLVLGFVAGRAVQRRSSRRDRFRL